MNESRRVGVIRVSKQLLAELLHFPEGHHLVRVQEARDFRDDEIEMLVEGPTLPTLGPGHQATNVTLLCHVTEDNSVLVPKREITGSFII